MKSLILFYMLGITVFCDAAMPSGDSATNSMGMKFKRVPAGSFMMGYEGGTLPAQYRWDNGMGDTLKAGMVNEVPRHAVSLRPFYMGAYEVGAEEFQRFRSTHPGTAGYPVVSLSWAAADSFCRWMTENDDSGWSYRLPTESEWEYCVRCGLSDSPFPTGQINYGNSWDWDLRGVNWGSPNDWGLWNMAGNAEEWCLDWYGFYTTDSATCPGGRRGGEMRVTRGAGAQGCAYMERCAMRFARPPVLPDRHLGFRVVMTDLPAESLSLIETTDTLAAYQENVAASRPAPQTTVSGESWTDAEGRVFTRVRMGREYYPTQRDSVVYVCASPITGDSGEDRQSAGEYAQRLSASHGVLYRIANKYELAFAGLSPQAGSFYLALLPDMRYSVGAPHPDAAWYEARGVQAMPEMHGPIFSFWNHDGAIEEADNGDLIAAWYSTMAEDCFVQSIACARLKNGESAWSAPDLFNDVPGIDDRELNLWNDGKGRLFAWGYGEPNYFRMMKNSGDNGAHWSPLSVPGAVPGKHAYRMAGDTVVGFGDNCGGGMGLSEDGGMTWKTVGVNQGRGGYHPLHALLEDGTFFLMLRSNDMKNQDSVSAMAIHRTSDFAATWTHEAGPFHPLNVGCYAAMLRLQSGRLLAATYNNEWAVVVLGESVDDGKTWFCRRKITAGMGGYMDLCQGKDGLIHLFGTCLGCPGNNPQVSFSEQWLREGALLPVSAWGINSNGMISDGSVTEPASLEPVATVYSVGAATRAPPTLVAAPNPFNPETVFRYSLGSMETGRLALYGVDGKKITEWNLTTQRGQISWNGKKMPSGLYFCRLAVPGKTLMKPVVLVK